MYQEVKKAQMVLHLNELELLSCKNDLYQVEVKLASWFWR
jgi:hypothetical protein